ncbi:MAG: hypothetical protein KatS3mg068_1263 [Candidatus Sericytochromatia bacterium]|nr:MAG: hypothetical protein KatS3mg068_1263 [Candidatus Sericytochromatia bacterium]
MAVAVVLGGASPDFTGIYKEVNRLSGLLSIPSPREINDPGANLKVLDTSSGINPPPEFETYIRPVITDPNNRPFGKRGPKFKFQLFYKNANNEEVMLSDGDIVPSTAPTPANFKINGQTISQGNVLKLDEMTGRIIFSTDASFNPNSTSNRVVGIMKLDAVTGLDMALINDRITQTTLVIEALNKVLTVANSNLDKAVELRI